MPVRRIAVIGSLALAALAFAAPLAASVQDTTTRRLVLSVDALNERRVADVRIPQTVRMSPARARATIRARPLQPSDSAVLQALRLGSDPEAFQATIRELRLASDEAIRFSVAEAPLLLPATDFPDDAAIADTIFAPATPVIQWNHEWVLPTRDGGGQHVVLRVRAGLAEYEHSARRFVGRVFAWAVDPFDEGRTFELDPPMRLQVVADQGSVDPASLEIGHSHVPLGEIRIANENALDSVRVHVHATGSAPQTLVLAVRPAIRIDGIDTSTVLQGWGVETVRLGLTMVGSATDEPLHVTLTGKGVITPDSLMVGWNAPARATLRTRGTGAGGVTAIHAFGTATIPVRYAFPWLFLVLVLAGGALGATLGGLQSASPTAKRWAAAFVAGIILPLAYFGLGLNLTDLPLPTLPAFTEIGAAVVAALMAWVSYPKDAPAPATGG